MNKIIILFLAVIASALIPFVGLAEVRVRDLSDVTVDHVLFQLAPEKNEAQAVKNRNYLMEYLNDSLKKQKDIYFGIYVVGDNDKLVLQLSAMDSSILQQLLNGLDKSQVRILQKLSLKGAIGFHFSGRGTLLQIATKDVFSHQELLKRLNLSNESHVQQMSGSTQYLVWINEADYSIINKSGADMHSFFKGKLQNEDFNIDSIIVNIKDKYTRR